MKDFFAANQKAFSKAQIPKKNKKKQKHSEINLSKRKASKLKETYKIEKSYKKTHHYKIPYTVIVNVKKLLDDSA